VKVDTRSHEIARVFASNDRDFLFIGNAVLRVKNGNALEEEFIGRVIVDDPHSAQPRLEYFKVWIVSQSLLHAST
jgi:hypothetical protein